jgi:hypothetical protein
MQYIGLLRTLGLRSEAILTRSRRAGPVLPIQLATAKALLARDLSVPMRLAVREVSLVISAVLSVSYGPSGLS